MTNLPKWFPPDALETVALAILNSDRFANNLKPAESRDDISESDGYVVNARFAIGEMLPAFEAEAQRRVEEEREACALLTESPDKIGREWVRDSLWHNITKKIAQAIRSRSDG